MAITAATYALGGEARAAQVVGLAVVGALTVVLTRGITKTARLARVLLTVTLACLLVTVLVIAAFTRKWAAPWAGAVSYTHLDVYKRQPHDHAGARSHR